MENWTAADIPHELLSEAGLVGWIPFRALQLDPRVSYCMYIPPAHYHTRVNGSHGKYPLPLIVNVHGTGRRAEQCCLSLSDFADRNRCAVLAPLFPTCIGTLFDLDNYKTLRYGSMRFDLLLLAMLDEVRHLLGQGIYTDMVFMMGFSGGGQFVHRFLYLQPERLLGVSIGAPGRPTDFLDYERPWPRGVCDVAAVFDGKNLDLERVRQVKNVQLIIGANDTEIPGKGLYDWFLVRKSLPPGMKDPKVGSSSILSPATMGRRDTLLKIQHELETVGIPTQLNVVPNAAHDFADMLFPVCEFWEPLLRDWHRAQRASEV